MTFLQVLGWFFGILLLLLLAVLFLPVAVHLKFKEEFQFKVTFAGIKVYGYKPKPQKTTADTEKKSAEKEETEDNIAKGLWKRLKAKKGFLGAVKEVMAFSNDCLTHIKALLRHIKFKNICLNLVYGSGDAADTAIRYGEICSAVYPVLALLDTAKNIKFKQIDVKSEFAEKKAEFEFSLKAVTRIFVLLIAAIKIYGEYKKFLVRNELQ